MLNNVGYQQTDYQLIVQSYAAPIGQDVDTELHYLTRVSVPRRGSAWVETAAVDVAR